MPTIRKSPSYMIYLTFLLISWTFPVIASDTAKEKRWQEQIVDSLMVGEAITLKDKNGEFLGLYADASTPKVKGVAIILHGIGVHPNWPDVIFPLRTELPDKGWATLSIQMPILRNEATLKDYIPLLEESAPRINAAVNYLKSKNARNIVLITHSLGAYMGTIYMTGQPHPALRAFVAIGLGQSDLDPRFNNKKNMAKITTVPVLDIFGSQDLDSVLKYAKQRKTNSQRNNKKYSQKEITGANHFFVGMSDTLVKTISSWLTINVPEPATK